ncbi:uncharacterized protein MELLADRAFT_73386 [Melampsora larici-populina 98AG31]|uniref:Uncharacterized protein n=1 Tax=Melampsora larici-populina (strain 98AG31 / pathotype 3-4-7) TaxID=747676 RepID=F4S7A7_MELLP|nr:uncharacterized protein MELLADRAFT_73386 [Melampsora larici-populina 98AG31]EGF99483.1 hypothetical protein MELLADRAFT_73386 [Melampsora larici-populina 98AG31]
MKNMSSITPKLSSKSQTQRPALACLNIPNHPYKNEETDSSRFINSLESLHGISILQPNPPSRRPMLYLFPRGDPEAPFVPLSTRLTFKIPVKQVGESDSDSSSMYPSTEEEEEEDDDEKNMGGLDFKESTKLLDSSAIQTSKIKGILKNSKHTPRLTTSPSSPASSLDSSSAILSPESMISVPKVRIVEPLDVLGELNELRKSLMYEYEGKPTLAKKIDKPLPASPKLGLKKGVTVKLVVKAYQRTPPATSSKARIRWISSRGLALKSIDDSRSVKLQSDHAELDSSEHLT